ncbi:Stk1 family PASTA domain-containing Ser/Thr kinase [Aeromicrobium sp. Root236]|uniref:Stk1 family PASTA domain-containing Ser/Thr kinase n=1 Tax=Aeromicrobium sp. Root236 TaxID=1736498 RepID=UPI001F44C960|nr:Stk1 family PASTA domain-containing Ser/Thr kinase [Aeromicrobium sp. Root236]
MTVTGDEALVGRVLNDRYLIGTRIARGGMASVFRAVDQRLDREVAIKVMHHGLGDDQQFTDRFVREAKSAAKLNHRNVVSVFDQGRDGDVTYLVMEYVPGRTLRDLMRDEAPMPPYRALELLEQVLVALSAAHAAKIIHRDVKPENVLITPDGDVKVADFGLARAVSAATTATGGTLIGTVSYLAPEIVTNDGADARSDIYACGAMLYEMLTGIKPHAGESPIQVAYKHVHEDIGAPSAIQPGIPPYVDALVARATVRDRDQRSTDARVMLQQVRSVQRALDAGLADDPDLVADLLPGVRHVDPDEARTVPVTQSAPLASRSLASDSEATEAVDVNEATVQWSAGLAPMPVDPATRAGLDTPPELPETAERPVGLHPPISPEAYKEARGAEAKSHRGRNLLILVVLLALLVFAVSYWFSVGRYDKTPSLEGNAVTIAKEAAQRNGFSFKVIKEEYSEKAPAGTVIDTNPEPGAKILPGKTIDAVVSLGPERFFIPTTIKGQTVAAATAALDKVHLKVGELKQVYDEKVREGRVVGPTNHTYKDELKRGQTVDLAISKGPKPIDVVDYRGRSFQDAKAGLEKAGFKVKASEVFSDDVAKGIVVSQDPFEGTQIKGDTITLTVSKGPELIEVPNVVGRPKVSAMVILKRAGFKVTPFGAGNFTVRAQTPSSGSRPKGSTVTIVGF